MVHGTLYRTGILPERNCAWFQHTQRSDFAPLRENFHEPTPLVLS